MNKRLCFNNMILNFLLTQVAMMLFNTNMTVKGRGLKVHVNR